MKVSTQSLVCVALVSLLGGAVAQETAATDPDPRNQSSRSLLETLGRTSRSSALIGATVKNYQEEKLGIVDNLAVDVQAGRIVQVIISSGGVLGWGDKLVAVPPGVLYCDPMSKVIYLNCTVDKIKSAPKFEMARWEELSRPDQVAAAYRHFDADVIYTFPKPEAGNAQDRNLAMEPVQRATKVKGMTVKNLQDQRLGNVEDLVVDLSAGRIVGVIVSSGGVLGLGDELSAVPPSVFRVKDKELRMDASRDLLARAPHFKSAEWPDMNQPSYASEFHRAYGIEPYFFSNPMTGRDNSSPDVRDQGVASLLPADQGNAPADRDRTALIRKAVVSRKELSNSAHNIKIITREGAVTLRGVVASEQEKQTIGQIAADFAHAENVRNQLEVK
jgi:hyperosmotically inducible protein